MRNAFKLAGKKDQEQGYKYFVKRARPEAHRAVRDRFTKDIRQFKIANKKKSNELLSFIVVTIQVCVWIIF